MSFEIPDQAQLLGLLFRLRYSVPSPSTPILLHKMAMMPFHSFVDV